MEIHIGERIADITLVGKEGKDVYKRQVSGNQHEGYEGHTFGFPGFQLCQHGVKGRITFDGARMEIGKSACFQHIVHPVSYTHLYNAANVHTIIGG